MYHCRFLKFYEIIVGIQGFKKIWSDDDEEFGDSDIEFYPSSGFHLAQSNSGEMHDLFGEYLCSSSIDPSVKSDAVSVLVTKEMGKYACTKKLLHRNYYKIIKIHLIFLRNQLQNTPSGNTSFRQNSNEIFMGG